MSLYIDVSGVTALMKEAQSELRKVAEALHDAAEEGAEYERGNHGYRNRTGNLERSTYADRPQRSGDSVSVEMGARAQYASFVEHRGYSHIKTRSPDIAGKAFEDWANALADRLGSK